MNLSKRRAKRLFFLLALCCLFPFGLSAQDRPELILFAIVDEDGGRFEIAVPKDGDGVETLLRCYQDNNLVFERPLQGRLSVGGMAVAQLRGWSPSQKPAGTKIQPHGIQFGYELVINNNVSTTTANPTPTDPDGASTTTANPNGNN